jgi:hypothetical protein
MKIEKSLLIFMLEAEQDENVGQTLQFCKEDEYYIRIDCSCYSTRFSKLCIDATKHA